MSTPETYFDYLAEMTEEGGGVHANFSHQKL